MSMITTAPSATTLTIRRSARLQIMRLRRMLDGWVAAAIAYRESQVAFLAERQLQARELTDTHLYRGPIDHAVEKATRLRQQRRKEP